MKIEIRNVRVIDPANLVDAEGGLFVADGRIAGVVRQPDGFAPDLSLDASGLVACPGLVDLCARPSVAGMGEDGIAGETLAAAAGGVTSVCCPPDADPVLDTPPAVELLHSRAAKAGRTRVYFYGALTKGLEGRSLADMYALKQTGCIGVSNGLRPVVNTELLRRAMEYAKTCDLKVFLYAEDPFLKGNGVVHEGTVSARHGLAPIPEAAETIAVNRALLLAELTGASVHFCRVSTARAAQAIGAAKAQGLSVSADVSIAHLHLADTDMLPFDANYHLRPPLRSMADRRGLCGAVAAGTVACICSDHAPCEADAKTAPFGETRPGISVVELLLPLTLRLVSEGFLPLQEAIARLTVAPARTANIKRGSLGVGAPADICLFDPNAEWEVQPATWFSAGQNSPFMGLPLKGRVVHTFVAGKPVFGFQEP